MQSLGRHAQCHVVCMFLVSQITYPHTTNWHRDMLDWWCIASIKRAWRDVCYRRRMSGQPQTMQWLPALRWLRLCLITMRNQYLGGKHICDHCAVGKRCSCLKQMSKYVCTYLNTSYFVFAQSIWNLLHMAKCHVIYAELTDVSYRTFRSVHLYLRRGCSSPDGD